MADIGNQLKIKYGLSGSPSVEQQRRWADAVDRYLALRYPYPLAGEAAAKEVFSGVGSHLYKSEGDTIEMLLRQVRDK
ncbi:hypothetical protein [Brevundimonas sp.]|uniref:hypothetical protein n=1 Tax=Brevundimonas sp. TaxID=1871086 RepID=UPI00289CFD7B|nr:hypothetical protein [Brevundimonas sp.]